MIYPNTYLKLMKFWKKTKQWSLLPLAIVAILSGCTSSPSVEEHTSTVINKQANQLSLLEQEHYNHAKQALLDGELKQAEGLLNKLTKKNPDFMGAWANLAMVYYQQKRFVDAEKAALKVPSQTAQLSNLLGLIAVEQGKFQEAEKYYRAALKKNQNYTKAHYNLALLYDIYYQEITKAVVHYKRYLELINFQDKNTVNWLEQLQNSLKDD